MTNLDSTWFTSLIRIGFDNLSNPSDNNFHGCQIRWIEFVVRSTQVKTDDETSHFNRDLLMFVNIFLSQPSCQSAQFVITIFFGMFDHVQQDRPTIIKWSVFVDLKSCLASEVPSSFVSVTVDVVFDGSANRLEVRWFQSVLCQSEVGEINDHAGWCCHQFHLSSQGQPHHESSRDHQVKATCRLQSYP